MAAANPSNPGSPGSSASTRLERFFRGVRQGLTSTRVELSTNESKTPRSALDALWWLRFLAFAGGTAIVLFAIMEPRSAGTKAISVALMAGGGALLSGGLLGFLFGIPFHEDPSKNPPADATLRTASTQPSYRANTNLEQISDWLTKIFVGVGLTQLTKIPGAFQSIGELLGPGLGTNPGAKALAIALVIYYLACGFLYGFLWSRLFLGEAFLEADRAAMGRIAEKAVAAGIESKDKADTLALSLVGRQLDAGSPGHASIPQSDLNQAIANASSAVKMSILNQTQDVRRRTWKDDKAAMERTIPIFRALIATDPEASFHRSRGNLGFALKDQRVPDWKEAEAMLTEAIQIRDKNRDLGWGFYELNRVICRLKVDPDFNAGKGSAKDVADMIRADLESAAKKGIRDTLIKDSDLKKWAGLNTLDLNALSTQ